MALDYYYAGGQEVKRRNPSLRQPQIMNDQTPQRKEAAVDFKRLPWLVALLAVLYALWWFLGSSFFTVTNIEYVQEPSARIKDRINSLKGSNILLLNTSRLGRQWQSEQPSIKTLTIYRGLPHTLKVVVEERSRAFVWQSNGHFYMLDANGVVFEETVPETGQEGFVIVDDSNAPITLGQQIVGSDFIKMVQKVLDELPPLLQGETINSIHVGDSTFNFDVLTDKNIRIKFDLTQPIDLQFEAVKKVYAENRADIHEYADVRVIGKIYIK